MLLDPFVVPLAGGEPQQRLVGGADDIRVSISVATRRRILGEPPSGIRTAGMAPNEVMSALLNCTLNDPATARAIADLEHAFGYRLPLAYRELLSRSNGLEGFVREHRYLALWSVEEIAALNDVYAVAEFAPGLLLIGTDGGDTGYALDTQLSGLEIFEVPLIGMSRETARLKGHSLAEFLQNL